MDENIEKIPNKYGIGSAGHVTVDVKAKSGYFEVWREIGGIESIHVRCGSIEQLMIAMQDQVRKILSGNMKDDWHDDFVNP